MPYTVPAAHYDNQEHKVHFEIGADFSEKLAAHIADGFEYCLAGSDFFLVRKRMAM